MTMQTTLETIGEEGLRRFMALQAGAISSVSERFYATYGSLYERYGAAGRQACREDLAYHLEFLRPVLEFGILQPMVDYLVWLHNVLEVRAVPTQHLAQSLDWLAEYFSVHLEPADAAIVTAALHAARAQFVAAVSTATPRASPQPPEAWPEEQPFLAALMAGDQGQALDIAKGCLERGAGLVDMELHVVQPALYRIGEMWQANRLSVAQEHLATAIAQSVMTACLLLSQPATPLGRRVLLACVEGNQHALGLRMVADAFQLGGWGVQYLGANVPTQALIRQTREWRPHLLGLSISLPHQLKAVRAIIKQLGEQLGDARPAVMIGGLAINRFEALSGLVGADAAARDPLQAVSAARGLDMGIA
ncbi:MAG: cobalamin-dependent protein [Pseudomonadota bacterium]